MSSSAVPRNEDDVIQMSAMFPEVTQFKLILDMDILLQCGHEVPDGKRREYVETSPSLFSSAASPPREVDCLSLIWPLPGVWYGVKVDGPQQYPAMAYISEMFSSAFE